MSSTDEISLDLIFFQLLHTHQSICQWQAYMTVPTLSYTYAIGPFGLQKFQCVLLPCHRTTLFTEIATNTTSSPSWCHYHNFDTHSTEGIALTRYERLCVDFVGIQWTMGNAHLSRWWPSLGILLVSLWVSMRTSLWLHLESEGTWYGNESR